MKKQCITCNSNLPLDCFYKDHNNKDGFKNQCKSCCLKKEKNYRQTNKGKEVHRTASRKYKKTIRGSLITRFHNMKNRCENPNNINYKHYGGRGIGCLFKSSSKFADYVINELQIDPRYLDIDRINNDGNYEPGNIRFVTRKENCNNRYY